jgi:hypothetical protein
MFIYFFAPDQSDGPALAQFISHNLTITQNKINLLA